MASYYFNEDCVVEAEYEKWTDKPTGISHQAMIQPLFIIQLIIIVIL